MLNQKIQKHNLGTSHKMESECVFMTRTMRDVIAEWTTTSEMIQNVAGVCDLLRMINVET